MRKLEHYNYSVCESVLYFIIMLNKLNKLKSSREKSKAAF